MKRKMLLLGLIALSLLSGCKSEKKSGKTCSASQCSAGWGKDASSLVRRGK